jgi:hypothetical protein
VRQHGVRVLSERDRELLRFVGEQYLVTLPQLAYLTARSERTARWLRTRWQRAGLVDAAKLLLDEPSVVWLTRRGLAAVGLSWKTLRPSYELVERAALAAEVRLAAAEWYLDASWVSRRALANCPGTRHPLPDGIISRGQTTVAIVAATTELDHRRRKHLVKELTWQHDHTLLVMASVSERRREWVEQQGRLSALAFRRDPYRVMPPELPALETLTPSQPTEESWPMPRPVDPCGDIPTHSLPDDG